MNLGTKNLPNETKIRFLEGDAKDKIVQCWVDGPIVNETNTKQKPKWKKKVAITVSEKRSSKLTGKDLASISLSLFFSEKLHKTTFDIDNYTKGIIDAVAKGLLSEIKESDEAIQYNEDDSLFRWIYHEMHKINTPEEEGVYVTVWKHGNI